MRTDIVAALQSPPRDISPPPPPRPAGRPFFPPSRRRTITIPLQADPYHEQCHGIVRRPEFRGRNYTAYVPPLFSFFLFFFLFVSSSSSFFFSIQGRFYLLRRQRVYIATLRVQGRKVYCDGMDKFSRWERKVYVTIDPFVEERRECSFCKVEILRFDSLFLGRVVY